MLSAGPSPSPSRRDRSRSGTTRDLRRSGPVTSRSSSCWAAWRSARPGPAGGVWRPRTRADLLPAPVGVPRRRLLPASGIRLRVEGPGVLPGRGRRGQGGARAAWYYPDPNPAYAALRGMSPSTPARWTVAWWTASWWCRSPACSTAAGSPQPVSGPVQGGSGHHGVGEACPARWLSVSAAIPTPQTMITAPVSSPDPGGPAPARAGRRSARPAPTDPTDDPERRPPRPAPVAGSRTADRSVRRRRRGARGRDDLDDQKHRVGVTRQHPIIGGQTSRPSPARPVLTTMIRRTRPAG